MAAARRKKKPAKRSRRPSSSCSKSKPCDLIIGQRRIRGVKVKTYRRYPGKAEVVLTGLPSNARLVKPKGKKAAPKAERARARKMAKQVSRDGFGTPGDGQR